MEKDGMNSKYRFKEIIVRIIKAGQNEFKKENIRIE